MDRWYHFFSQWQKDFKLWLFCMSFFLTFRVVFLLLFMDQMADGSTFLTVVSAVLNGMRFDSVISTIFIAIPFLFSAASGIRNMERLAERVRVITGIVFLALSTFLCIVTVEYFREFGDQFNDYLFGLVYDDLNAIFTTIVKSYHVLGNAVAFLLVLVTGSVLLKKFIRLPLFPRDMNARLSSSRPARIASTLGIAALMVVGARGSIGAMPVRERHAAITSDEFLNKTVINPYTSLYYAVSRLRDFSRKDGIRMYIPDRDMRSACAFFFGTKVNSDDLDRYMLRSARGQKGTPPRHVFLVIAESYSAWPLWDAYAPLHIADGVKALAAQGISIAPFIASSQGTMAGLNSIVTGLPDIDIKTNYRPSSKTPYPTTISRIFKDMGYTTRLFYGGYLSWQRIGDFCRDQGFDEIHGGGTMGKWVESNEWGVDDEHIFSFVLKTVSDERPSFNIILTTSLHPPYTVDVDSKGFHEEDVPASVSGTPVDREDIIFLGHFWYADRCIERFSRAVANALPRSLVVITADHPARRWITKNPGPLEKYLIPCVLYGPEVLGGVHHPQRTAGSHLDLIPTLVELCAPRGFPYHAMGEDLLGQDLKPAVGNNLVLDPQFLLDLHDKAKVSPIRTRDLSVSAGTVEYLRRYHDTMHGIAWWRVMRGAAIVSPPEG